MSTQVVRNQIPNVSFLIEVIMILIGLINFEIDQFLINEIGNWIEAGDVSVIKISGRGGFWNIVSLVWWLLFLHLFGKTGKWLYELTLK